MHTKKFITLHTKITILIMQESRVLDSEWKDTKYTFSGFLKMLLFLFFCEQFSKQKTLSNVSVCTQFRH